jgi:hypothetical protein
MLVGYVGSWAFVAPFIASRYLVYFCPFFIGGYKGEQFRFTLIASPLEVGMRASSCAMATLCVPPLNN